MDRRSALTTRSRRECSSIVMPPEKLRSLALDLNQTAPRSPYAPLGASFPAVAARLIDKCRAELLGQAGSYHYNCPMDRRFFAATGLKPAALRDFISTGADDAEVASWMRTHAEAPSEKIAAWSRRFRANPLWRLLELEDWLHKIRQRRGRN
jgi:hypothetical protein